LPNLDLARGLQLLAETAELHFGAMRGRRADLGGSAGSTPATASHQERGAH
jgi:hypothetical protein